MAVSIGLSMIIRDEPVDRLAMLVESLRPVIDEIVFVDTGSVSFDNDSVAWKTWGANIYQFDWIDDFSAARNFTLDKLSTDWVLQLDADEIASAGMIEHMHWFKNTHKKEDPMLGIVYHRINYTAGIRGEELPYNWHTRLFDRQKCHWYRELHELVMIDGKPEYSVRGSELLRFAPEEAYIIHSKPESKLKFSEDLYHKIENQTGKRFI